MSKSAPAGDTFSPYYGEFLLSPSPIELSFNYCSHKCAYCFANLNKPGRFADSAASLRLLADLDNRKTLLAHLLRERYPVLVSNRTDPFAASNWRVSLPVLRVLAEMGIPIDYQTRGGRGWDEAAAFTPPSVWYVSVTIPDESIRKQVEPASPPVAARLDMIRQLTAGGHRVVVGVNPAVPEWIPDPAGLFAACREAGAEGVALQALHLSRRQIANMSEREKAAIGPARMRLAERRASPEEHDWIDALAETALSLGLSPHINGGVGRSEYFKPWQEVYPKRFPVQQEFINACYDLGYGPGDLISASDWIDFHAATLPTGEWEVFNYIGATTRRALGKRPFPYKATYRQLLARAFWDETIKFGPARSRLFSVAAEANPDGSATVLSDENGHPYFVFAPAGHELDVAFVEDQNA